MKHQKIVQLSICSSIGIAKPLFLCWLLTAAISCKNSYDSSSQKKEPEIRTKDSVLNTVPQDKSDANAVNDYKEKLHDIVKNTNNNLGHIELTGNPEQDFARQMTTNLLRGIEICLIHQKNGIDSSLRQIAIQKKIYLQKQEDYFDAFQFNNNSPYQPTSTKKVPTLKHLNMPDAVNKDIVFAAIISEYIQNIIDLANGYLKKGSSKKMRKVAQGIIQNFSYELMKLRRYIN